MYSQFKISAKPVERSVSFSEFLRYIQSQPNYLHDAHWRPQADFLGTTSGKTLYRIDGIGRMLRDVGLSNESPIERKNKSSVNSVNESALLSGRLFEKTPNKIAPSDVTSYNDFLSKSTYQQLSLWLKEDFDIFESTH